MCVSTAAMRISEIATYDPEKHYITSDLRVYKRYDGVLGAIQWIAIEIMCLFSNIYRLDLVLEQVGDFFVQNFQEIVRLDSLPKDKITMTVVKIAASLLRKGGSIEGVAYLQSVAQNLIQEVVNTKAAPTPTLYFQELLKDERKSVAEIVDELHKCVEPIDERELPEVIAYLKGNKNIVGVKPLLSFFKEVHKCLKHGFLSTVDVSSGGVYFGHSPSGRKKIVIKPKAEEADASFNFKFPGESHGVTGADGFRVGHKSGEAMIKECAAHYLNHLDGYLSKLPITLKFRLKRRDIFVDRHEYVECSVQKFVKAEEMGELDSAYYHILNTEDVQGAALMALISGDTDGHCANALWVKNGCDYIPIDQGFTRLSSRADGYKFEAWENLPQVYEPILPILKRKIEAIDPEKHASVMRELGFHRRAISLEKRRIAIVKEGVSKGQTVKQIAVQLITRL